jgi:hypothetical protein
MTVQRQQVNLSSTTQLTGRKQGIHLQQTSIKKIKKPQAASHQTTSSATFKLPLEGRKESSAACACNSQSRLVSRS